MREIVVEICRIRAQRRISFGGLGGTTRLFPNLYVSMVRVGEEAGVLPKVMSDLADLLEHEDEVRGEVISAVAYPVFVLGFGIITVTVLLTWVMPRLFGMLQEMLPGPAVADADSAKLSSVHASLLAGGAARAAGAHAGGSGITCRTPEGGELWDRLKFRLPMMGSVFRSAALSRFARTLGTLAKSGVSLLPALKIVENTIGNRVLARQSRGWRRRPGAAIRWPVRCASSTFSREPWCR